MGFYIAIKIYIALYSNKKVKTIITTVEYYIATQTNKAALCVSMWNELRANQEKNRKGQNRRQCYAGAAADASMNSTFTRVHTHIGSL